MRIGVLGTGNMADALATHWVQAGHDVTIGGRDAHKAERLATRIGGSAKPGSLRAAAESGQVVLAVLPFGAGAGVARDLHAALEGKVLLDCSNPVGPGFRLLTEGAPLVERSCIPAALSGALRGASGVRRGRLLRTAARGCRCRPGAGRLRRPA